MHCFNVLGAADVSPSFHWRHSNSPLQYIDRRSRRKKTRSRKDESRKSRKTQHDGAKRRKKRKTERRGKNQSPVLCVLSYVCRNKARRGSRAKDSPALGGRGPALRFPVSYVVCSVWDRIFSPKTKRERRKRGSSTKKRSIIIPFSGLHYTHTLCVYKSMCGTQRTSPASFDRCSLAFRRVPAQRSKEQAEKEISKPAKVSRIFLHWDTHTHTHTHQRVWNKLKVISIAVMPQIV